MTRKRATHDPSANEIIPAPAASGLVVELRQLIDQARERTGQHINSELVMLHWHIGERIKRVSLKEERAELNTANKSSRAFLSN